MPELTHHTGPWPRENTGSLAEALAADSAVLFKAAAEHPWVRALAEGSLPEHALTAWAQQCRLFCRLERPALQHLRSLIEPGELDDLLARLVDDTERENRELAEMLAERGAAVPEEEWPVCLGYGSYVQACARRGLLEGLAAVHAVERDYLDTWSSVLPETAQYSPYRKWIENWSSPEFRAVVTGLGACLDRLAGPPTVQLLERLSPIYRRVAKYECAFWWMAWDGQDWPGTGSRP